VASAPLSPRCSLGRARKMAEEIVRKNSKTRQRPSAAETAESVVRSL
jgi:hypothetical protein